MQGIDIDGLQNSGFFESLYDNFYGTELINNAKIFLLFWVIFMNSNAKIKGFRVYEF